MARARIRKLLPGEGKAFVRSARLPFLEPMTPAEEDAGAWEDLLAGLETERSWVAEDTGRLVGNCTVHSMDVTVPGPPGGPCPVLAMAGVSAVGVHPTHRRQGLLTEMMGRMLADARRRGEPIAGLLASESVIYGRFGFGMATDAVRTRIASRRASMIVPPPELDIELLDPPAMAKTLPALRDRLRVGRAGEPVMAPARWRQFLADRPSDRRGATALMAAACDQGYVTYRARHPESPAEGVTIEVQDLRGADPAVEAGLWQFLFGIDLSEEVVAWRRPLDEPLRWRLADPRQLRMTDVADRLYVRILDMPGAFGGRGYSADGRLVLDVTPPPAGGPPDDPVPGRWVLEAAGGGGQCRPAGPAERTALRLDVTALGALYMGAFPASLLAAAGRLEEVRPGAVREADLMLLTRPRPLTVLGF